MEALTLVGVDPDFDLAENFDQALIEKSADLGLVEGEDQELEGLDQGLVENLEQKVVAYPVD